MLSGPAIGLPDAVEIYLGRLEPGLVVHFLAVFDIISEIQPRQSGFNGIVNQVKDDISAK